MDDDTCSRGQDSVGTLKQSNTITRGDRSGIYTDQSKALDNKMVSQEAEKDK
jgi:hypothetical protein